MRVIFEARTSRIEHITALFKHTPDIVQLSVEIFWGTGNLAPPQDNYRIVLPRLERLYLYACDDDGPTRHDLLSFLFDDATLANIPHLALSRPITFLDHDRHARDIMRHSIQTFEVCYQSDWLTVNGARVRPHHLRLFPNLHTFIGDCSGDPVSEDLSLGDVLSPEFPSTIENVRIPIILWQVTEFEPINLARLRQSKLRRIDVVFRIGDVDEAPGPQERLQREAHVRTQCLAVQAKLAEIGITMTMAEFDKVWCDPQILKVD